MSVHETRYAKSEGLNIAYQVTGDGPFDLVYVPGFVSNVELGWEEPMYARFLNRLASFSRLITFDKRGTGMSDRVPRGALPSLEERMDDLTAVLDAVGSERAAFLSHSEGGNLSILYAVTHPERTIALVTAGIFAARRWSEEYPWAPTPEQRAKEIANVEATWGGSDWLREYAPSYQGDPAVWDRLATYFRRSATPGDAAELLRINTQIDVRSLLPLVRVPTLMLHRTGDRDANIEEGRWIATQIPGATFIELPGDNHIPWIGDADTVLDHIQQFLTGARGPESTDRVLATVLFTDIVESTSMAARLGDQRWRELLDRHDRVASALVEQYRGTVVKSTGDGLLALFDGPARAVRCALDLLASLERDGLEVRAGLHAGEVERRGDDVSGIAVHIASRIESLAAPREVWVSRTVTDLVAGSGLSFEDRGSYELAGVPGRWDVAAARV